MNWHSFISCCDYVPMSEAEVPQDSSTSEGSPNLVSEDVEFNDFFSLRRPRDAVAGFASGMKSIAKGVAGGTVSLIAAPAVYAHQEGWKGLGKGLVVGVTGAAVLPVVGVAVGVSQMARGVINTPEAIVEKTRGRFWDSSKREWVTDRPLPVVTVDDYPPSRLNGTPQDSAGYYAILEVDPTASMEDIKRQYFLLARRYHPDKNPDDPEAKERFQALGEAYQVLADPKLRQEYDRNGTVGLDVNFMDGVEFFGMLFGCEQFEYLIGEMFIATSVRLSGDFFDPSMKRFQVERVEKLATNLKALLKRYEEGDHQGFILTQEGEAERLAEVSFGKTMLYAIGRVYEDHANIYLGDFFQSTIARFRQRGEVLRTHFQAAKMAVKVISTQKQIEKMDGKLKTAAASTRGNDADLNGTTRGSNFDTPMDESEPVQQGETVPLTPEAEQAAAEALLRKAEMEEAALPVVLEALWAANVLDIQSTIKKVCRRVLCDAPRPVLKSRAEALRIMGGIFCQRGLPRISKGEGVNEGANAKNALEQAMLKVVEKRNAMDDALYGEQQNQEE